jgi:type VI secretion system protein ImpI
VLKLKIENFDQLPDGGPVVFQVDRRGFDLGRAQHLDWTLPDPTRCISSKHCEVRYMDGAYWLYDVSTNGTFVNRSSRRVQSPYKLADGDQLEIGDYIISVAVEGEEPVVEDIPPEPASSDDLWDNPTGVSPPIDPRELLPPIEQDSRASDFLSRVVDMPAPNEQSAPPAPSERPAPPPAPDPWAPTGIERSPGSAPGPAPGPASGPPPSPAPNPVRPQLATGQVPFDSGHQQQSGRQHVPPRPAHEAPFPGPAAARPAAPSIERGQIEREFLRQFALGANLPEDAFAGRKGDEFAYELGALMRIASANLMQLLTARAAAKTLARSTERTMIQQTDNNPLKFMPSAEEAVRVMLSGSQTSYLDGRQAFERGFADLQTHQMATYTAMQQALKALLEDLDPQAISSAAGTSKPSLLGSSKAKAWETYAARWEAKAGQYEHGMLDAFLMLFSEFYDRASRQRR